MQIYFILFVISNIYYCMKEFIKLKIREHLIFEDEQVLKLNNDGLLNKPSGNQIAPNTIYLNGEPIVDFGISKIGPVKIGDNTYEKSIYLQGGFNAAKQKMGYGTMALKYLFNKLPLIQNLILQCYDTACPFWEKMGGIEIDAKEMGGGHPLRTLLITRNAFNSKIGL